MLPFAIISTYGNAVAPEPKVKTLVAADQNSTQVAALLMDNGKLFWRGTNTRSQLGAAKSDSRSSWISVRNDVQQVWIGGFCTIIWTGTNFYHIGAKECIGATSTGTNNTTWTDITSLINQVATSYNDIQSICLSTTSMVLLHKNGTLYGIGYNTSSELGIVGRVSAWRTIDSSVQKASTGDNSLCYIKNNSLYVCGLNTNGQFGNGNTTAITTPTLVNIANYPYVTDVMANRTHTLVYASTDNVSTAYLFAAGNGQFGQLGNGAATTTVSTFVKITTATGTSFGNQGGKFYNASQIISSTGLYGTGAMVIIGRGSSGVASTYGLSNYQFSDMNKITHLCCLSNTGSFIVYDNRIYRAGTSGWWTSLTSSYVADDNPWLSST